MRSNKNPEIKDRKWGDRRDGRFVRDVPGLQTVMGHLMPYRTENEVYINEKLDATELLKYLEKKNAENPDLHITIFHCLLVGVARMVMERPKMNRFIQGHRMYQRDEVSLAFVAKRKFADDGGESLMFLTAEPQDSLVDFTRTIQGEVGEMRKSDKVDGIDLWLDRFAAMPRLLLMFALKIIRWLDFWGKVPRDLTEGDPNYSSVFLSNLGSIKCPAVYHHLNNYGTNSIMVTIGTLHKEEMLMPDGSKEVRDVLEFGATLDERIADGFYFGRSLRLLKHIFANPEMLELPLGTASGFQYE